MYPTQDISRMRTVKVKEEVDNGIIVKEYEIQKTGTWAL